MLDGAETTFISPKSGVIGGCLIFHGFRFNDVRLWYWSPHFHVLGVIKGGYGCRNCNHERGDCRGCSGFNGREVRGFEKDGYIVKVMGERKTIFGTAHYQLHHATVRVGIKRFHVVTWHGNVSYNRLKAEKLKAEVKCPACSSEMVRSAHVGERVIVKDIGSPDYVKVFADDKFDSSGLPNYVEVRGGGGNG